MILSQETFCGILVFFWIMISFCLNPLISLEIRIGGISQIPHLEAHWLVQCQITQVFVTVL